MNVRPLVALGLASAALVFAAPAASAAEVQVGPWVVQVPDLAPAVVPVPFGSEAAPLPALPYPLVWATPVTLPAPVHAAPAPAPVRHVANCTEARNLGVAPIYRGDVLYRPALDRDNDGVACE